MHARHESILRSVLALPTASFREHAVAAFVDAWAARTPTARLRRDGGSNLLLTVGEGAMDGWVFVAHMDHPGFVLRHTDARSAWAEFRGSVSEEYFPGSAVRFFGPDRSVRAVFAQVVPSEDSPFALCRLELDEPADLPSGTVGMWDLPAMRVRGTRIDARAIDDLAGVAAVLCALGDLAAAGGRGAALLTRAEEVGFIGALAACRDRTLPTATRVVSIEASKAQPGAELGDGVILRVGDRARTFDPSLTAHLAAVAGRLAEAEEDFRFTRHLMPGGTCEATAFAAWSYATCGLCVPLGNYHNMGRERTIRPERIDARDFACLVRLLTELGRSDERPSHTDAVLRQRMERLLTERGRWLQV